MPEDRVANVRTIAARIATTAQGLSVREFLDASALAAGKLIKALYRGPGVEIAIKRYSEALQRAVKE